MGVPYRTAREIDATVGAFRVKVADLLDAATHLNGSSAGDCNRLNDYVHEVQGVLHNLERQLAAAGKMGA